MCVKNDGSAHSSQFSPQAGAGFLQVHYLGFHRRISPDLLVYDIFNFFNLGGGQRGKMGEIEAQPVGRDQGSCLFDVPAEDGAKRSVQEVRCRVIIHCSLTALQIDLGKNNITRLKASCQYMHHMSYSRAAIQGILDPCLAGLQRQEP
jgi:hypothetical protein